MRLVQDLKHPNQKGQMFLIGNSWTQTDSVGPGASKSHLLYSNTSGPGATERGRQWGGQGSGMEKEAVGVQQETVGMKVRKRRPKSERKS